MVLSPGRKQWDLGAMKVIEITFWGGPPHVEEVSSGRVGETGLTEACTVGYSVVNWLYGIGRG